MGSYKQRKTIKIKKLKNNNLFLRLIVVFRVVLVFLQVVVLVALELVAKGWSQQALELLVMFLVHVVNNLVGLERDGQRHNHVVGVVLANDAAELLLGVLSVRTSGECYNKADEYIK
jgi:hypothetical protein